MSDILIAGPQDEFVKSWRRYDKALKRNARRTEKRVRKTMVKRYLDALDVANTGATEGIRRGARFTLDHIATNLRDCERVEIDRRLGIDALPAGRGGL